MLKIRKMTVKTTLMTTTVIFKPTKSMMATEMKKTMVKIFTAMRLPISQSRIKKTNATQTMALIVTSTGTRGITASEC